MFTKKEILWTIEDESIVTIYKDADEPNFAVYKLRDKQLPNINNTIASIQTMLKQHHDCDLEFKLFEDIAILRIIPLLV